MDLSGDLVGGWLQLPGSATAEIMGSVGFGFVCVDTQHGLIGDEARAAVEACHHPPRGARSYGPTRVTWRPGRPDPVCIVMVETAAAVVALPGILAVPGIDAIFVGPSDLALSTGLAQEGDPSYDALLRSVVASVHAAGLPIGIYCASPAHVHRFRALGFTFFALPSEASMLRAAAAEQLERSR